MITHLCCLDSASIKTGFWYLALAADFPSDPCVSVQPVSASPSFLVSFPFLEGLKTLLVVWVENACNIYKQLSAPVWCFFLVEAVFLLGELGRNLLNPFW